MRLNLSSYWRHWGEGRWGPALHSLIRPCDLTQGDSDKDKNDSECHLVALLQLLDRWALSENTFTPIREKNRLCFSRWELCVSATSDERTRQQCQAGMYLAWGAGLGDGKKSKWTKKMQSSGPLSQIHFFLSPYSSLLACEDDGNGGKFLEGYVPSALGTSHEESSKGP